jgi:anaerobic ribonucleoside-triphosphate reductase activating protein
VRVAVSRLHFPVSTLGPGRRLGLWLQGCSLRCPGCISVDTWQAGVGLVNLPDLLRAIGAHAGDADGLTVSGGEPFEQPHALAAVLRHWRLVSHGSTLVFTGYEIEDVADWLEFNPGLVDCVISGRFRSDVPQTLALRGSDNQRLHVLTELGREMRAFEREAGPQDRRLDVMFDPDGQIWMAGIPARGDLARVRRALTTAGHQILTSAEREIHPS